MIQLRYRRLLLWGVLPVALIVLLYAGLGFLAVPRLLRSGAQNYVTQHYHRSLALGDIRFNPFTLRLDVSDLALPDSDGRPMLAFRHLMVDLTVASIWHLGPDFQAIVLQQPYARVLIRPDGTLNLKDLAPPPGPRPQPTSGPGRLFINHFSVQDGSVAFEDHAHPSVFSAEIRPINFDLRNFSTVGQEGGSYSLSASSEAGERFSWGGSLSAVPLSSHGQFEVANLQARTLWNYVRDSVRYELPTGSISLRGDYDFTSATSPIGLAVNVHDATLSGLAVRPKGGADDYIKLDKVEVQETRADLTRRSVTIGSVHLTGGAIHAWTQSPGTLNLMELSGPAEPAAAAPSTTAAPAPPAPAPAPTPPASAPSTSASSPPGVPSTGPPPPASPQGSAPPKAAPAAQASAGPPGSTEATPATWTVAVPDIAVDALNISVEDRQVSPAVAVHLDGFQAHVTGFSLPRSGPVTATLTTPVNREGKIDLKAELQPDSSIKAHGELAQLDLSVLQPYIAQRTDMTLRSGLLSARLDVEQGPSGKLSATGSAELARLRTVDNVLKRDFIRFDRLQFEGIDFTSTPRSLRVHSIVARAPYARVIVESDRTVNVAKVLRLKSASQPPGNDTLAGSAEASAIETSAQPPETPAPAGTSTGATAAVPTTDSAEAARDANEKAPASVRPPDAAAGAEAGRPSSAAGTGPTGVSENGARSARHRAHRHAPAGPAPASQSAGDQSEMAIAIDTIRIEDGSANYADLWIQPHFAVGIQTLHGTITGLKSDPRARAKVELQGKVDRYAPVHIWGEINPLAATAYSDIKLSFKGVELSTVTPYSGRFAGYKIEKGKLSVDIGYKIENRQLSAQHRFVIDQLELGERVDSPDAVKLPLKIAVALLKDRNGVIDVNLPVSGSLDNPQFRLGPLIWKAVLGLLTKVATAPFAALGHLFGGGPQMKDIDFNPGSAGLDPPEHDKLTALAKALKEKTQLKLDVPVTFSPDLDRPALAIARLDRRLLALSQPTAGRTRARVTSTGATGEAGRPSDHAATHEANPAPGQSVSDRKDGSGTDQGTRAGSGAPDEAATDESDPALSDPGSRFHLLVALYREELGKSAPLPASAQVIVAAKKKGPPPDFGPANAELQAALLPRISISDDQLEALGRRRAQAVQDALLGDGSIDPSRVFIIGSAPRNADKDKVRLELSLK